MTRKPLAPKTVRALPGDSWTSVGVVVVVVRCVKDVVDCEGGWVTGSSLAVLCGLECPAAPVKTLVGRLLVRIKLSVW